MKLLNYLENYLNMQISKIEEPRVIKGDNSIDTRGVIRHVNNFDLSSIKRIYEIENISKTLKRGWKGHKIQNRWFLCSKGKIQIEVTDINFLENKNAKYKSVIYTLEHKTFDVLYVPKGYATKIQQKETRSRVLVFADFFIDFELDELRWEK